MLRTKSTGMITSTGKRSLQPDQHWLLFAPVERPGNAPEHVDAHDLNASLSAVRDRRFQSGTGVPRFRFRKYKVRIAGAPS